MGRSSSSAIKVIILVNPVTGERVISEVKVKLPTSHHK